MVTVIVPVCPGSSTSGVNGVSALVANRQASPVVDVAVLSNALVCTDALYVALPVTGPFVGPSAVGVALHSPWLTRPASSVARAVRPCGCPYSSGTPLMRVDASKSAGTVADCSMVNVRVCPLDPANAFDYLIRGRDIDTDSTFGNVDTAFLPATNVTATLTGVVLTGRPFG